MIISLFLTVITFLLGAFFVWNMGQATVRKQWNRLRTLMMFLAITIAIYIYFLYNLSQYFVR